MNRIFGMHDSILFRFNLFRSFFLSFIFFFIHSRTKPIYFQIGSIFSFNDSARISFNRLKIKIKITVSFAIAQFGDPKLSIELIKSLSNGSKTAGDLILYYAYIALYVCRTISFETTFNRKNMQKSKDNWSP